MLASFETNIVKEATAVHLDDLNEIPWHSDSYGQQTKTVESGITLWSFPGPGNFELKTEPQHTWLVLKGRGRLQFGQRIVAISGGVVLSDLHDSFATFMVPDEEEIVLMDVVLAPSRNQPEAFPPAAILEISAERTTMIPSADPHILASEGTALKEPPSPAVDEVPTPEPDVEPISIKPESPRPDPTVTKPEPTDEDPPLPWTAKLRSH